MANRASETSRASGGGAGQGEGGSGEVEVETVATLPSGAAVVRYRERAPQEQREAFVVVGETGQYDNAVEWAVAVYEDREKAERHAREAAAAAEQVYQQRGPYGMATPWATGKTPYDPGLRMGSTGTAYSVVSVPFLAWLPSAHVPLVQQSESVYAAEAKPPSAP